MSWAFLIAQLEKNPTAMQETLVQSTEEVFHSSILGLPLWISWSKNPPSVQETWVGSLGWEDSPEEGKGYPLQYSGLENSMDCIVHGVAKNQTQLSDFHFMEASTKCPKFNTHILSKWHVHH